MSQSIIKKLGVGKRYPTDSLFVRGDEFCRMFVREGIVDIDNEELCHQIVAVFPCEALGCSERFSSLLDFEMHYNSCHRFICSQCRKPLPSAHFLDLHLSETHDSFFAAQAERKPMFRCFVEECPDVSQNVAQRRTHCIEDHSFPHDFRYDESHKKNKKTKSSECFKSKTNNTTEAMVTEERHEKKQHSQKSFNFCNSKKGKSFAMSSKPWHTEGKSSVESKQKSEDISTAELMDTLPS